MSLPLADASSQSTHLAVLIDADNAQAAVIEPLLAEVAKYGEATVKRIYGDFTAPTSAQWKKALNKHAIKPVQQFAYTTGKNATDSTLIIDAMDLLYTGRFGGFCLVSSDSDFTGLALRIKEEGLIVLGFGERKTPDAFRNACHKFIFTELLRPDADAATKASADRDSARRKSGGKGKKGNQESPAESTDGGLPKTFLIDTLNAASDEDGWADLATYGNYLTKLQPDFDPRLYGYRKLSALVQAQSKLFEVEQRQLPGSSQAQYFVRAR